MAYTQPNTQKTPTQSCFIEPGATSKGHRRRRRQTADDAVLACLCIFASCIVLLSDTSPIPPPLPSPPLPQRKLIGTVRCLSQLAHIFARPFPHSVRASVLSTAPYESVPVSYTRHMSIRYTYVRIATACGRAKNVRECVFVCL